jgi:hypothetical protein
MLPRKDAGWRTLTLYVAGGGIIPGYVAAIPFRGSRYAHNPTIPPARRLRPGEVFVEIIRENDPGQPLHPHRPARSPRTAPTPP